MQDNERARRLVDALELIRQVRGSFRYTKSECECCGLTRYDDWEAMQMAEKLGGCVTRLEKAIKELTK